MTRQAKLTKPQAIALAKWRDGRPKNEVAMGVRQDVYWRLLDARLICPAGFCMKAITDAGLEALRAYEAKHGEITR